jgi:chromosome segregation ATPase
LIKELIDRLEKEASNEEGQKQWCDKATAEATDKRDRSSQRVSDLNAALEMLEARIAQLTDDIARLNSETAELEKSLAEATAQREQEAKENYEAIHEATAGYESVQWAKLTLHEFYIPANRAQVDAAGDDLVMNTTFDVTDKSAFKSKADFDAPDAGFENYESYQGKQGAATMLLGMMDVIISDFDRTITETRKTERQAAADYMKYKTETETTIASNNADVKAKTEQKGEDQDSERQTWRDIDSANAVLKGSVKELMDLRPVCVDTGMSFKERSDLRKNEITSLLKALCMMNAFQDGAGEDVEKFGKCDDISWGEGTQDAA